MHNTDEPYVVTLGTAGGPRWWADHEGAPRAGISTAVVVGDRWYLVDCGSGAGQQARRAGLKMSNLAGIFITHMHSDHTVDLASLLLFGSFEMKGVTRDPVPIIGPSDRGTLPPLSPRATSTPTPVSPDDPTPGIKGMVEKLVSAYATDVNDRIFDSLAKSPLDLFEAREIHVDPSLGFCPNENVAPEMDPIEIFRDDHVRVTATLVSHHPTAPAFGFRLDTAAGSVTISGDTSPCENLIRLAHQTDLLLHEAINLEPLAKQYSDPEMLAATMDHHRRAHTTAQEAGEVATASGCRRLALHHLVPSYSPPEAWDEARQSYLGPLAIPNDLDRLSFSTFHEYFSVTDLPAQKARK